MNERRSRRIRRPLINNSTSQRPSTSKPSSNTNKPTPSTSRQKPTERQSSTSRLTRSTAKTNELKCRGDDEGPRRVRVINVGDKFQVPVPPFDPDHTKESEIPERETCVWAMEEGQDYKKVVEFCKEVQIKLNLNEERALYHLYRNHFDYDLAMQSAINSSNLKDEWSDNDKYCFHGLFSTYGRDFQKIHQIMAHKSMRSIIDHYYRVKLQNNYASILDRDNIGYDLNRKNSADEKAPDVLKPSGCQNCGTRSLLYHINNLMQCLACKKYFEEFNSNRSVDRRERTLNFKYADEVVNMVNCFKEMFELQPSGKSKCEETKQNAMHSCRLLRSEALRKDVNAGRIAQKVVNEVNIDEYKKLLTAGNASTTRLRITNVWTNNEKNVAVQGLIRYGGNIEAVAAILGTKSQDMVTEFYNKYEQVLNEAIKIKPDTKSKRQQKAQQDYNKMLVEIEKNVEVVDID